MYRYNLKNNSIYLKENCEYEQEQFYYFHV